MVDSKIYPRLVERRLIEALEDAPVVLLNGPRQWGKTTLARRIGEASGYTYFSLDDEVAFSAAVSDPIGFAGRLPSRCILDEVQRVPGLFPALKTIVDRRREAGRFLVTGSANALLVHKMSESLAGRMEVVRLHPFAQCELEGRSSSFFDQFIGEKWKSGTQERVETDLIRRIVAGGFPPALIRPSARRRRTWYRNYLDALIQRDVRELARIRSLDVMPRLIEVAAGQTARPINVSDLAGPFQVSRPTIREYLTLLQQVFLIDELPPWHSNRLNRLVKSAKLHLGDSGLACALLGVDESALSADRMLLGQLTETFVFQKLRRQASGGDDELRFHHYRDKDGFEVDIVIERGQSELWGIEVKAGATVTIGDFRGLHRLQAAVGRRFCGGAVLYDGTTCVSFGKGLWAVPIGQLWKR